MLNWSVKDGASPSGGGNRFCAFFWSPSKDEKRVRHVTHGPLSGELTSTSAVLWARAERPGVLEFVVRPKRGGGGGGDKDNGEAKVAGPDGNSDNYGKSSNNNNNNGNSNPSGEGTGSSNSNNSGASVVETEAKVVTVYAQQDNDCVGKVLVGGLQPNTVYEFTVADVSGEFRTAPAESERIPFAFAFGACLGGQGYGREVDVGWQFFKLMQDIPINFFMIIGDSIYADNGIDPDGGRWNKGRKMVPGQENICTDDIDTFFARYRYHLEDPHYAAFLRNHPIFATWDDHEVLDNWCGSKVRQMRPIYLQSATRSFFTYWPLLSSDPDEPYRIYRKFQYGALAEFFVLDTRTYRSLHNVVRRKSVDGREAKIGEQDKDVPFNMETMLGKAQTNWLKNGLVQSKALWKFIVSSVPVSWPTGGDDIKTQGYDGWSGALKELQDILQHVEKAGVKNYAFLTSDVHYPSVLSYDFLNTGRPQFYEFGCGPLHALCLPPPKEPDHSLNPKVLYAEGEFHGDLQNMGHVSVAADGVVTYQVIDSHGKTRFSIDVRPR